MTDELTVINERVDDIPLLVTQMERMGVPSLLDEHFPTHGNWEGLILGWTIVIWLAHILSEGGSSAEPRPGLGGAATEHDERLHWPNGAAPGLQ